MQLHRRRQLSSRPGEYCLQLLVDRHDIATVLDVHRQQHRPLTVVAHPPAVVFVGHVHVGEILEVHQLTVGTAHHRLAQRRQVFVAARRLQAKGAIRRIEATARYVGVVLL